MLGMTVTDKITGFKGTAIGHVRYITGCNQVLVQPRIGADGKVPDSNWIDEQRLDVDSGAERIILNNGATPGFDKAPPKI